MDLFKAMHREVPQEDWFRLRDNFLRERGDPASVARKSMLLFRSEQIQSCREIVQSTVGIFGSF